MHTVDKMELLFKMTLITTLLATVTESFRLSKSKRARSKIIAEKVREHKVFFNRDVPSPVTRAKLGHSLILVCEAGGSPIPTIHWLFEGSRIQQSDTRDTSDDEAAYEKTATNQRMVMFRVGATRSKLYIDCLTSRDVGQYTCVAETTKVRRTTSTQIKIVSPFSTELEESCMMKKAVIGSPARIYMWTAKRLEFEGADVQLFCRANGNPMPHVKWYDKNGKKITEKDRQYSVLKNGDLLIRDVNWFKNMGTYKCVAENSRGTDESSAFLYPTTP